MSRPLKRYILKAVSGTGVVRYYVGRNEPWTEDPARANLMSAQTAARRRNRFVEQWPEHSYTVQEADHAE